MGKGKVRALSFVEYVLVRALARDAYEYGQRGRGRRAAFLPNERILVKVLDLFSGLNGWSRPWKDHGHEVFTVDIDRMFESSAHLDILDTAAIIEAVPWKPDVILASPPCQTFSMMSVGRHWTPEGEPKTEDAKISKELVLSTLRIIAVLQPKFWVIENPRARLRSIGFLDGVPRYTVTYCQYGEDRMKPTDLWGVLPRNWSPRVACSNGDPCHIPAPRGSRTGTQGGVDKYRSAMIPYELSDEIRLAAELSTKES